jgi:hypothetical protein
MTQPINRVRRRNRAVEDESWIRAFLRESRYGVVATESEGQPFATPVTFVFDEATNSLYFHTSPAGRVSANLARNPRCCFNASRAGSLLGSETAANFDIEYESVTVFGRAQSLAGEAEKLAALRLIVARYFPDFPLDGSVPLASAETLARTAVYRIPIESWSGKRNPNPA